MPTTSAPIIVARRMKCSDWLSITDAVLLEPEKESSLERKEPPKENLEAVVKGKGKDARSASNIYFLWVAFSLLLSHNA